MTKMSKDTAIKLFGRTIPLHEAHINPAPSVEESVKVPFKETPRTQSIQTQENQENQAHSKPDPNPNPQDSPTKPESNNRSESNESGSDKTLKKPDKIIPCPRCNSMDTKFCYYNNYNVNQPRHFCKNCQRYWTAGGTMRNVPVGAGRRKNNNKHINVNQFRQVMLTSSSPERFLGQQQQAVPVCNSGTGTVLKFGTDVPLCESMQNNLSIKEEKNNINNNNSDNNNVDEQQSSCNSNSNEPGMLLNNSNNNVGPTMQCYNPHGFMWGPAIPMPFIPASFWPGPWWTGFTNVLPSSPNSSSSSGSPTLGKHARETSLCELNAKSEKRTNNNNNNGNLWAPKTVRLVDPEEAAKSSILATLGIKKDDRGIFGNFAGKEISGKCDAGPVLNANPAALSRFQSFQERT